MENQPTNFSEDSSGGKLFSFGDYLRGYKPSSKSTFDLDQQFARPIEDEDLFFFGDNQTNTNQAKDSEDDCIGRPIDDDNQEGFDDISFEGIESNLLEHEDTDSHDNVIEDDSTTARSASPSLTPAQIEILRIKEKIKQQAQAIKIKPKIVGDEGTDIIIDQKLEPDSKSKPIFNQILNKSKKVITSPVLLKQTRTAHIASLRKTICAEKRQIWNSFQQPVDNFDDEEELIEESKEENEGVEDDEVASDDDGSAVQNHTNDSNSENQSPDDLESVTGEQDVEGYDSDMDKEHVGAFDIENESRKRPRIEEDEDSW